MNLNSIIKIVLAVLFLVCLLDMPYGYYQLVRFIGMIGFGLFAFTAYTRQDNIHFIIWLASAILINPIFKITIGHEIWNIVDVIWAFWLLVSIKMEKKNEKRCTTKPISNSALREATAHSQTVVCHLKKPKPMIDNLYFIYCTILSFSGFAIGFYGIMGKHKI